jgi:hypothetical protein
MSLRATVLGAVTGLFPIGWIVLNVIFLYRLTVEKGASAAALNCLGRSASETGNSLLNAWGTGRGSKILRSNAGKMVREITGAMV